MASVKATKMSGRTLTLWIGEEVCHALAVKDDAIRDEILILSEQLGNEYPYMRKLKAALAVMP